MNKIMKAAVSVTLLLIAHSSFACDYPQRIDIPNGVSSTKDAMIAGQSDVKAYMTAMESYLACIESEEAASLIALGDIDEDTERQRDEMFNKKHNAAVEEMNLVAEEFNVQVRAYKEAN